MCSFGSCKTRFEFLSQFRKVRNAFECFVTQVQTRLPKTKRVWPMKINVYDLIHLYSYICIRPLCYSHVRYCVLYNTAICVSGHIATHMSDIVYYLIQLYLYQATLLLTCQILCII